jgi:hypothetical protein
MKITAWRVIKKSIGKQHSKVTEPGFTEVVGIQWGRR